jgi:hypothetical protein
MARRITARRVVGIGIGLVSALMLAATSASATVLPPDVPQDVAALLSGPAVQEVQEAAAETQQQAASTQTSSTALNGVGAEVPDFSGRLTAGPAHQVYGFTDTFVQGGSTDTAVAPSQEWIAPLVRNGTAAGTIRIWKPDGHAAELAGFTGDATLGTSPMIDSSVVVIEDETVGTYYRLDGDTLTPLAASGQAEFAGPVGLEKAQSTIAARRAKNAEESQKFSNAVNGLDRPVSGSGIGPIPGDDYSHWTVVGLALATVGAAGVATLLVRRHRRSTPASGP